MKKTIQMTEKTRKALFNYQISFLEDLIKEECAKKHDYCKLYYGEEMHTHFHAGVEYGVYNGKIVYILDRLRDHLVFTSLLSKVDKHSTVYLDQIADDCYNRFYYVDYLY